jgi:uncharacterized protein (TIGR03382 family)
MGAMRKPSPSTLALALSLVVGLGLSCGGTVGDAPTGSASAPAHAAPPPSRGASILKGYPSLGDPEVFQLIIQSGGETFLCSSTLIGQRTLVTAAHCVVDADAIVATNQFISIDPQTGDFAQNLVYIPARIWQANPLYDAQTITNDIAVVGLSSVPSTSPKPWNTASLSSVAGDSLIRLVGYGEAAITGRGGSGAGLKRTGNAELAAVKPTQLTLQPANAVTCFGDSGGAGFYTFPDGVERLVGVTSFGDTFCGENATQTRVDAFAEFINANLALFDPPSCDADGICVPGCMPEDVDCTCAADGVCNADCPDASTDPDCAASCGDNNLCARTACATADVDCRPTGSDCERVTDCAGTACISDAQHVETYCSHACTADTNCETGFSCQGSLCRHLPLPEVAPSGACTPEAQYCTGGTVCARPSDGGVVECRTPCGQDTDCTSQQHCAGDPDATYCDAVQVVTPPATSDSKGCSSASGLPSVWGLLVTALLWKGARRGRRTAEW